MPLHSLTRALHGNYALAACFCRLARNGQRYEDEAEKATDATHVAAEEAADWLIEYRLTFSAPYWFTQAREIPELFQSISFALVYIIIHCILTLKHYYLEMTFYQIPKKMPYRLYKYTI